MVEGGEYPSIFNWEERLKLAAQKTPEVQELDVDGSREDSRPPSSGLSSLGDRTLGDDMDMT
jgi:transcription initiation factor TFIID subunit 3